MKENYKIIHCINRNSDIFFIHNFNYINEVVYFGFNQSTLVKKGENKSCIGVWKIKSKK